MKNTKIERVLDNIVDFLQKVKGPGTTTVLREVSSEYDCTTLVSKEEDKKLYEQSINVNCIKDKDTTTNPILIEKEVLFDIANDVLSYIEALKKEVAVLKEELEWEKTKRCYFKGDTVLEPTSSKVQKKDKSTSGIWEIADNNEKYKLG